MKRPMIRLRMKLSLMAMRMKIFIKRMEMTMKAASSGADEIDDKEEGKNIKD